jgi:error-prone DNA polymerase
MSAGLPAYAELHCLSNFSFLKGASHPAELVERAHRLGYTALAITDECSLAGVVRAHVAAKEIGLPLIIGAELALRDGPRFVCLATDRASYGHLSALITRGRRRAKKGTYELAVTDIDDGLPGCLALLVPGQGIAQSLDQARLLRDRFGSRAWIAVELLARSGERDRLARLQELSEETRLPLVAAGDVTMHVRGRRALHDVVTAIRIGKPVDQCGLELQSNGERHLRTRDRLAKLYPPELLAATIDIASRCDFSLDSLRYEYPEELVPDGLTPTIHLRALTEAGLRIRFPYGVPDNVRKLIEHELALIAELRYEAFFLTVHDIVAFARSRDILCQGRGSAANSAVCYALQITEVDPARMSMLFERFISRERNEPPDIDVDFEHQRREEVIQYIYAKYGRERAAIAATLICYRSKSAIRDVGKALGLSVDQVDRLSSQVTWWSDRTELGVRMREAGFDPESKTMEKLIVLVDELMGFPRHLSQHVGGFVISRGPLSELVPVENAAMPDRSVIEWDKDDLDALGLLKIDVLALGMLSAIRRGLAMVSAFRGRRITMADIPAEDPAVYAMLQKGDSTGVFQVESRAQMTMLPRLKPACFYDLVIEVAIVRPGPIQGGMVHPYLRRRQGLEPVTYPSPEIEGVLSRTLGVPIFQEQVMQLAIVAAGFSPGEADQLRRAMAAWKRRGGLEPFEARLIKGMLERGYEQEFAEAVFRQIQGFGEYGFPESHSASFALLVYVSAWIKCHEPAAFLAALLNSQPMGFYGPSQLVQDARKHGVDVRPVDVLISYSDCTLEQGPAGAPAVRLGLRLVKGLSQAGQERIEAARIRPFDSIENLALRASLDRRDMNALAAAGALAPLSGHRNHARWEVVGIEKPLELLRDAPIIETAPVLRAPTEGQDLVADYGSLGLTLGRHPLALLRGQLATMRLKSAKQISELPNGSHIRTAGIVTCRQRPGTASGVIFVTLEDETGNVNVIVWNNVLEKQRRELLQSRLLGVAGQIQREGEVIHLVAAHLFDYTALLGSLTTTSRDFH